MQAMTATTKSGALSPRAHALPPLAPDEVELQVSCCALCHSDLHLLDGDWSTPFPFVPGHEVVGRVVAVGSAVDDPQLRPGARVGVGWQCGACHACPECRAGLRHLCSAGKQRTCVGRPGGLAERVRTTAAFAFAIPEALSDAEAAPLLCAGVTVYSPLARLVTRPGSRLGVIGLGGLGHLAVQFGKALGCTVTAFDPDAAKDAEARQLGAVALHPATPRELAPLRGRFDLLLSTTHAPLDWDGWMSLLAPLGTLCLTGVPPGRVDVDPEHLLDGQKSLTGSVVGSPETMRAMLAFAAEHAIKPWVETQPMTEANAAIARLRAGKARYRVVLTNDLTP